MEEDTKDQEQYKLGCEMQIEDWCHSKDGWIKIEAANSAIYHLKLLPMAKLSSTVVEIPWM